MFTKLSKLHLIALKCNRIIYLLHPDNNELDISILELTIIADSIIYIYIYIYLRCGYLSL